LSHADILCSLRFSDDANHIHLKVIRDSKLPSEVEKHNVPIFTMDKSLIVASEWDLTTQQVR
jgi:hypothetical protein